MTNTITKVTEQCSPLQCFEDVGQGQTVANTQGEDSYTACQCASLFAPAAIPIAIGLFGRDGRDAPIIGDPKIREVLADIKERCEELSALIPKQGPFYGEAAKEAYWPLVERFDAEVMKPLLEAARKDRTSPSLQNDIILALKYRGDLLLLAREYGMAERSYLTAARRMANYADVARESHVATQEAWFPEPFDHDDLTERQRPFLNRGAYLEAIDGAVEAMGKAAIGRKDGYKILKKGVGVYHEAALVLSKWNYKAEADEVMKRAFKVGVQADEVHWLEKNVEDWIELGRPTAWSVLADIDSDVRSFLENKTLRERYVKYDKGGNAVGIDLKGVSMARIMQITAYIEGVRQRVPVSEETPIDAEGMANRCSELSRLYLGLGDYDGAIRGKAWEIEYRHVAGDSEGIKKAASEGSELVRKLNESSVMVLRSKSSGCETTRAIGVEGEGGLGAIGTERKGEEGKGHGKEERKGKERPGK